MEYHFYHGLIFLELHSWNELNLPFIKPTV